MCKNNDTSQITDISTLQCIRNFVYIVNMRSNGAAITLSGFASGSVRIRRRLANIRSHPGIYQGTDYKTGLRLSVCPSVRTLAIEFFLSIFTKIGTYGRTLKSKNKFLGVNIALSLAPFCRLKPLF